MKSLRTLVVCSAIVIVTSIFSFLAGSRFGAQSTAAIAKQFANADRDFKLLLEKSCTQDAYDGSDDSIRELMISGLRAYNGSVAILERAPFNQEMHDGESDLINSAIQRLEEGSLELRYKGSDFPGSSGEEEIVSPSSERKVRVRRVPFPSR